MYLLIFTMFLIGCSDSNLQTPDKLFDLGIEFRKNDNLRLSITNFKKIIENYPKSTFAAKSHYQIADIYLNDINNYQFALKEFELLINSYPNAELAKKSSFMVAYIYSNYLDEYSRAIDKYKFFLKKYPEDELVPSVIYELEGLKKYEVTIDSLKKL